MSNLIEVRAVELIGPALDWAVAQVEKPEGFVLRDATAEIGCWVIGIAHDAADPQSWMKSGYAPSTDWSQCGPLIEKYKPWLSPPVGNDQDDEPYGWDAEIYSDDGFEQIAHIVGAPTALVAVCRAIVHAKLGETVKIPWS